MKKYTYLLFTLFIIFSFYKTSYAEEKLYKYRIEYYYDNVLEKEATTYKNGTYASLIVDYETKNKDGYSFSHSSIDDAGMTITDDEDANVIKVFYEKKEDSIKVEAEQDSSKNIDAIIAFKQKLQSIFDFFKRILS